MARQVWSSRTTFLLAAIGSAVGLGNLWRFPYVAFENGGGAFLVPYFIALLTAGIPLLLAEYALGHRSKAGAPHSFRDISPRVEWIGWWAILTGFVILTYYMAVMAWSWFYAVKSFSLPWAEDTSDFFFNNVLQITDSPMELGNIVWPLAAGVLVTWIIIYLITRLGTKSVEPVVKWTVPIPYILLAVLLGHGLSQVGSAEGLIHYLTPSWSALTDPQVWIAAYGQVFFSLSIGFGVMIAYASYLGKKEDLPWQSNFAALANSATEFFAGFVVFAVLGAMASVLAVDVSEVVAGGPGLAFVAFPQALAALPAAEVFSFIFFIMLIMLGVDSAFSLLEAGATAVHDRYPKVKRQSVVIGMCVVGFLISLLYVTQGGLYWLDIVDHWMNSYGLVGVGLATCLVITGFVGTEKIRKEINSNTIRPITRFWDICISFITPLALIVTLYFSLKTEFTTTYEDYPAIAIAIGGWGMWIATIVIALLLQKNAAKWIKLLVFGVIAGLVLTAKYYSVPVAIGIGGSVILLGGLTWLLLLDRNKAVRKVRNKSLKK